MFHSHHPASSVISWGSWAYSALEVIFLYVVITFCACTSSRLAPCWATTVTNLTYFFLIESELPRLESTVLRSVIGYERVVISKLREKFGRRLAPLPHLLLNLSSSCLQKHFWVFIILLEGIQVQGIFILLDLSFYIWASFLKLTSSNPWWFEIDDYLLTWLLH